MRLLTRSALPSGRRSCDRGDFNRLKDPAAPKDSTAFARGVYRIARDIDEFAGNADEGTSVNAGLKVMRQFGLVKEWNWSLRGVEGLRTGLLTTGPGILGMPWLSGMYRAPGGILTPSGSMVGGHAIYCPEYRMPGVVFEDDEAFGLLNSWGPGWGDNGFAWIRGRALAELLAHWGEAAIITKRSYGR